MRRIDAGARCRRQSLAVQQIAGRLVGTACAAGTALKEKLALALRHLEMLIEYKNESVAVKEMRRHIGAYLKGMPKAAEYRGRFHQTETYADFKKLLAEYIEAAEKFGA